MNQSMKRLAFEELPPRVSEKELAQFWSKSPAAIRRARSTGHLNLPYLKIGRQVLYRREDIAIYEATRLYLSTHERYSGLSEITDS